MGEPSRPTTQHQGPASHCVIDGKQLGWLSCSAYSTAMGIDKATLGTKKPSGCEVRSKTGDTVGGLSLPQVAAAAAQFGVAMEVHSGPGVAKPDYVASQLRAGRGLAVQGNTRVLINTPHRSTTGGVNHCIEANDGRGWNATTGLPAEVLVYDPAADGRRPGIAQSPQWWTWALLCQFAAALQPWGDNDPRQLGAGKMYVGIFPDTEPHCHLQARYAAYKLPMLPTKLRAVAKPGHRVNVRSGPSTNFPIVMTLPVGAIFRAFQGTKSGQSLAGSKVWVGNHNGDQWIHSSGVKA